MKTNLAIGAGMVSAAAMAIWVAIATKIRLSQRFLQHLFAHLNEELFDPYRPEKHYMRGPGPKWRQKHGHVTVAKRARKITLLKPNFYNSFKYLGSD
jgi:hypothetical protein